MADSKDKNIKSSFVLSLFLSRDERALKLSADNWGRLFYRIAKNITGDAGAAEELVNDTLLRLWQSIPPAEPESICAYGSKIVHNLAVSRVRKERAAKRPEVVCELEEAEPELFCEDKSDEDVAKLLEAFISGLKEKERTLFLLRYYEEESCECIAKRTGMSSVAVRTALKRIRDRLKKYLEKRGIEL